MAATTLTPESGIRHSLKPDDQPARNPRDSNPERASSRVALDRTLARLSAAMSAADADQSDLGFSCEWWPPD
jgi:hypothetical protein